jgi:tetratricopeptide (TPR) repeat protein
VPLLVATPFEDLGGLRVGSQVSAVDVFPTVLALCGIEPPAGVHGRSLVPLMLRPGTPGDGDAYSESMTPNLQFGWSPLLSLRTSRYKLIEAPRPELYDLAVDRGETTNVIAGHPDVAEELKARLDRLVADTGRDAPEPESANLDKETLESLAALGYIGAPVGTHGSTPGKALADPKDKLGPFTTVQRAGELLVEDKYAEAAKELEPVLREEPEMPQARLMLATCYAELGRTPEAKAQFDRVLKDDPRSVQGLIGLASVLRDEGRTDDVIALCKRTLSLDGRNNQAYALLGEMYAERGEPDEALPNFEKAVEIQPKLTRNRLNLAGSLIEARQYARAEALLKDVVREYPKFPLAQFNLGLLYDEQGRPAEARSAYAAEVAAYPQHFRARFNLGKVLFQLGARDAAVEQMREVVRIAPTQPEGYLFLARGLLQTAAPVEEVQPLVEKGLSLARKTDVQALGYYLLADVFSRRGQPDRVNEALRQAERYASATRSRSRHETGNP